MKIKFWFPDIWDKTETTHKTVVKEKGKISSKKFGKEKTFNIYNG